MTEALWTRYARLWSLDAGARGAEMRACLAEGVSYADPKTELEGLDAFAACMDGFRAAFPGHRFAIRAVRAHHGHSLARWDLLDAEGRVVFPGLSFGQVDGEGRFLNLRGFFGGLEGLLA